MTNNGPNHTTLAPLPKHELRLLLKSWEFLSILFVSIVIGSLLPTDILDRLPMLGRWVHAVATWFPTVDAHRRTSAFPEISALYFATLLVITPILTVFHFRNRAFYLARLHQAYLKRHARYLLAIAALLLITPCFFYLFYLRNDGDAYSGMAINQSRIALATLGWIFAGGGAWVSLSLASLAIAALLHRER